MDIYDELLSIVKTESDLEEFLTHENKWEYLYNLSNIRKNVLEWYDFNKSAKLLELGSECGAVTGLFCERVNEVVALEKDEKKCKVNEARNGHYKNLRVVCSDIEKELEDNSSDASSNIEDDFDYVTIIGNVTPAKLRYAKNHLRDKGKLIIAVENKYGIKYWSGEKRPQSYSRMQLIGILRREGYMEDKIYYPIPDYILPMEIYSSNNLPKVGSISAVSPSFIEDKVLSLDELEAYDMVIRDGKFEEYANSFIVFARKNKSKNK